MKKSRSLKIHLTTFFPLCPNIENEFSECSQSGFFLFCNLQIDSVTLEKAQGFLFMSLCMKLLKVPTESMELIFWIH